MMPPSFEPNPLPRLESWLLQTQEWFFVCWNTLELWSPGDKPWGCVKTGCYRRRSWTFGWRQGWSQGRFAAMAWGHQDSSSQTGSRSLALLGTDLLVWRYREADADRGWKDVRQLGIWSSRVGAFRAEWELRRPPSSSKLTWTGVPPWQQHWSAAGMLTVDLQDGAPQFEIGL